MRVRGGVGARAVGLLDGGADLVARVGAGRGHAPRRADAARDEDLDVVGAAPQVLARAAADLVHAVVAGERPAVAIVRGEASSRHQEARPGTIPAATASRSSRSRKCSSPMIRMVVVPAARSRLRFAVAASAWGTGPRQSWPSWSPRPGTMEAWLWQSMSPGITKRSLQSTASAPAGDGVVAAGPTAAMRPSVTTTAASRSGAAPVASNSVPQRITRVGCHVRLSAGAGLARGAREVSGRLMSMSLPGLASLLIAGHRRAAAGAGRPQIDARVWGIPPTPQPARASDHSVRASLIAGDRSAVYWVRGASHSCALAVSPHGSGAILRSEEDRHVREPPEGDREIPSTIRARVGDAGRDWPFVNRASCAPRWPASIFLAAGCSVAAAQGTRAE